MSLNYTFSLAENIIVYTPKQGTNTETYFNHINYKDKTYRLWWEINTFPTISSLLGCVFSIFRRKKYEPNQKWTSKCLVPRNTINTNISKKSEVFP